MYDYRNVDGTVNPEKLRACMRQMLASNLTEDEKRRWVAKFSALSASREHARPSQVSVQRSNDTATIDVFGSIGEDWYGEGLSLRQVVETIKNTTGTITLRINSGGGDAFEGDAIYSALIAAPNRVEVEILALAASAATVVAMAGDEIRIAEHGVFMIHRAQVGVYGDVDDLESAAQLLRASDTGAVRIYARKTGKTEAEISEMVRKQTWLTGQEAVDAGFASRLVPVSGATRAAPIDLGAAPERVRALLHRAQHVTHTHMDELLKRLGLAADASQEQIIAALDAALAAAAVPAPQQAVAVVSAEDAAAAHALAVTSTVERFISEGKIAPASRAAAVAACGTTAVQLNATVKYWEGQPAVVVRVGAPATAGVVTASTVTPTVHTDSDKPTDLQARMCRQAGITWEQFKAQRAANREKEELRRKGG